MVTKDEEQLTPEQLGRKVIGWFSKEENKNKTMKYSLVGVGICGSIWLLRVLFGSGDGA